ncbi:MAG: hypothetical protein IT379_09380 [Deltaproteobacteria bacterium]|nr:hypothetical protein [Deltaproteobacteria bacterium]
MRLDRVVICPRCDRRYRHEVICPKCHIRMLDERLDREPVLDVSELVERVDTRKLAVGAIAGVALASNVATLVGGPIVGIGACLAILGATLGVSSAGRLAWHVRVIRHRRAARRALETAGPVTPARDASDGHAHVRGTVRVLRTVTAPSGEAVAAYRWDVPSTLACGCSATCEHVLDYRRVEARCGRLAVVDATGVAVLDDDCFLMCSADPTTDRGETLVVRHGDTLEVVGPARRGEAPDARSLAPGAGYRAASHDALLFDGSTDTPVIALVPPPR